MLDCPSSSPYLITTCHEIVYLCILVFFPFTHEHKATDFPVLFVNTAMILVYCCRYSTCIPVWMSLLDVSFFGPFVNWFQNWLVGKKLRRKFYWWRNSVVSCICLPKPLYWIALDEYLSVINFFIAFHGETGYYPANCRDRVDELGVGRFVSSKNMQKLGFFQGLVGGLEHFFPYIWNNHPNWLIFFRGVAQPPTSHVCWFTGGHPTTTRRGSHSIEWMIPPVVHQSPIQVKFICYPIIHHMSMLVLSTNLATSISCKPHKVTTVHLWNLHFSINSLLKP